MKVKELEKLDLGKIMEYIQPSLILYSGIDKATSMHLVICRDNFAETDDRVHYVYFEESHNGKFSRRYKTDMCFGENIKEAILKLMKKIYGKGDIIGSVTLSDSIITSNGDYDE